ncbi:GGDEF domain-containing protein [Brevibacillus migulae]|uniref:GGDEF domain-containing protein n=1 Tax=Brevibacillus migulae TaxID=1644114 RepID=UPI00106E3D82|nr:GGDEF domain-containing protein [Brevibacillus migulae]
MKYTGKVFATIAMLIVMILWHVLYIITDRAEYLTYITSKGSQIEIFTNLFGLMIALWAGHQFDRATFFSQKDALTKVFNRRFIDGKFPKMLTQARKGNRELSLLVIDINQFKQMNDQYGHKYGDTVLQKVASALVEQTRKTDIVCRWGGDEFIVILLDSSLETALSIKARIERTLANDEITLSIGCAVYPHDATTVDDLMKAADHHMYKVKRGQ